MSAAIDCRLGLPIARLRLHITEPAVTVGQWCLWLGKVMLLHGLLTWLL